MRRMYSENQIKKIIENGNLSINGELTVSSAKIFENIKDAQGHNRFIEGDLDVETISGVEFTYSKWSLSGTHLMIVLAGRIAENTVLNNSQTLCTVNLPQWIKDKLYVIFGAVVDFKSTNSFASDWSSQSIVNALRKYNDVISISNESTTTYTKNRSFRIAYDLLIDNVSE